MDLFVLGLYIAAIAFLGWRAVSRRKAGAEDYILASRTLTLPAFVSTLVPSFFGGTLGVGEYTYRYGVSNWLAQGVPYYVFALLYALWLAGRIRAAPGMTISDHLERAYGRPTAILAAFLVFLLASPADELLMLGTLAQWVTRWPMVVCLSLVAAVCLGFLFLGGFRSDVSVNRLEFTVMYGGFLLILPFAYVAAKGAPWTLPDLPPSHLSFTEGQSAPQLISWFFIALWTFVDPSFHQRVCAAKDAKTARNGILISMGFWFLSDAMTTAAGLYARGLIPDLANPLQAYPALAERLLPPVFKGLFLAGVASSTLAALSSSGFLAAISLGRDAAGKFWNVDEKRQETWIRWGLVATGLLSVFLALALPSVVDLWFTVGSTVIPGLLMPLLSAYFEPLRLAPKAAFACSLAGWLGASAAWALGVSAPFYAGLAASLSVWGLGKALARP